MNAFDLPNTVTLSLLSEWIRIGDLAVLDSAVVNHDLRKTFLHFVSAKGFYQDVDGLSSCCEWLAMKKIKVNHIDLELFSYQTDFDRYIKLHDHIQTISTRDRRALIRFFRSFKGSLSGIILEEFEGLTNDVIEIPSHIAAQLSKFVLSGYSNEEVTDKTIEIIIKTMPRLTNVELYNLDNVSESACIDLLDAFADKLTVFKPITVVNNSDVLFSKLKMCLYLHTLDLSDSLFSEGALCQLLAEIGHNFKDLNLYDCTNVTSTTLKAIARHCPAMSKLVISNCHLVDDSGIEALSKNCKQFHTVVMSGCVLLTDSSLMALFKSNPYLTQVELSNCSKVSDFAILSLFNDCPNLKALHIFGTSTTESCLFPVAAELELLDLRTAADEDAESVDDPLSFSLTREFCSGRNTCKSLVLTQLPFDVSNRCIDVILSKSPQLKTVIVVDCDSLTDASVATMCAKCPMLTSVHLCRDSNLTAESLLCVAKTYGSALAKLEFDSEDVSVTEKVLLEVLHLCGANLKVISLKYCTLGVTDDVILYLATYCKYLMLVEVCGCSSITDSAIISLIIALNMQLRDLDVEGCTQLTCEILAHLALYCPNLKRLDTTGCEMNEDHADICRLLKRCPRLEKYRSDKGEFNAYVE